jgi:hypothetical protein
MGTRFRELENSSIYEGRLGRRGVLINPEKKRRTQAIRLLGLFGNIRVRLHDACDVQNQAGNDE